MYYCSFEIELNENLSALICVEFSVSSYGCPGDHWSEPEGPEFHVESVEVEEVWSDAWTKEDLGDWYSIVQKKAEESLDAYGELYFHQLDVFESLEN